MAAPVLSFLYNTGADTAYSGSGGAWGDWKVIDVSQDQLIFTGGGIQGTLPTPTAPYGARDATVRPAFGTYVVPQLYVEDPDGGPMSSGIMNHIPTASGQPNTNQYVLGVYVQGTMTSDLYLEAWDTNTFTTTDLPVLSGTGSYPYSMVNAIRTTHTAPPASWNGGTGDPTAHDGKSYKSTAYLKGFNNKLRLKGEDSVQNEPLYYTLYIRIPNDASLFHNQPIIAFRYLYS